jgi:hypothetical protein
MPGTTADPGAAPAPSFDAMAAAAPPAPASADAAAVPVVPHAVAKNAAHRLRCAFGAKNDAVLLDRVKEVTMVDLSSGVIDAHVGSAFIAALKAADGAPKLTQLYLHANVLLGPSFAAALSAPAIKLPALTKVHLQECALGDAGAGAIANALRQRAWPVEVLNLGACELGDDGAVAIAVTFRHGVPSLRELNLGGNEIGDVGSVALAGALFGTDELHVDEEPAGASAPSDTPAATTAEGAQPAGVAGGGEGGEGDAAVPAPRLEALRLNGNRIGYDGLLHVHTALQGKQALSRCPVLAVFDVRGQRGSLMGAVGSGRSAAAVKKAADLAATKVAVALAQLSEEAPAAKASWLAAMGAAHGVDPPSPRAPPLPLSWRVPQPLASVASLATATGPLAAASPAQVRRPTTPLGAE